MCDDAQNPNEYEEYAVGKNVQIGNAEIESNGRRFQDTLPDFAATMRTLRVEMQSHREDNERLVKASKEHNQLNSSMLQILTDIQRQMNSGNQTLRPEGRKRYLSASSDSKGSTTG